MSTTQTLTTHVCERPRRRRAARRFAVVVAATVAVGTLVPQPAEAARRHERYLYNRINKERIKHKRVKVRLNGALSKVARRHSLRMMRRDRLYHRSNLASGIRGRWRVLGENVGYGHNLRLLHRAFMNSRSHRANVLYKRYRYVGIGAVRARDGTLWVTVIFKG